VIEIAKVKVTDLITTDRILVAITLVYWRYGIFNLCKRCCFVHLTDLNHGAEFLENEFAKVKERSWQSWTDFEKDLSNFEKRTVTAHRIERSDLTPGLRMTSTQTWIHYYQWMRLTPSTSQTTGFLNCFNNRKIIMLTLISLNKYRWSNFRWLVSPIGDFNLSSFDHQLVIVIGPVWQGFTVDPPLSRSAPVDPPHVRPKCGCSVPGAGSFRPNGVGVRVRLCTPDKPPYRNPLLRKFPWHKLLPNLTWTKVRPARLQYWNTVKT